MSDKQKRAVVSLEDFLRVTVVERDRFDSPAKAAAELGMTEGSFKQRMTKERKAMPDIFESVPKYHRGGGRKRATQAEAMEILASLRSTAANSDSEEWEDVEPGE